MTVNMRHGSKYMGVEYAGRYQSAFVTLSLVSCARNTSPHRIMIV